MGDTRVSVSGVLLRMQYNLMFEFKASLGYRKMEGGDRVAKTML